MVANKSDDYFTCERIEMLSFIPEKPSRILEVGCGEGFFAKEAKTRFNCEAWGIEYEETAALKAKEFIDTVLIGDVDALVDKLPDNYFDCIVFNDVLEHLQNPHIILKNIQNKLTVNGCVVASIPNVRYIKVLQEYVFKKDWQYKDCGVLDRTHLRFFTEKSIREMFKVAGYKITELKGINGCRPGELCRFNIFNFLTCGFFADSRYPQYACVAKRDYKTGNQPSVCI